jgi:hypothetical protein
LPATIRIDFYKTEDEDSHDLDISAAILRTFELPFQNRRVDFGAAFVFLHNVRTQGSQVVGEIVKTKMTELPDKVSRVRGEPEDLGLRADEGIGHHAHFLYDNTSCVLLVQRDREVRASAFVKALEPSNIDFKLSYIFKGDALARLGNMRMIRKLTFKVATPRDAEAFRELDPSAAHAIELLNGANGRFIDISISVGKSRDAALERQSVLRTARSLFGYRGEEVQKILVSGKEDLGAATEMIDLFEDRLNYETQVELRGRRIDPGECERVIFAAHREHAAYLRRYRHPE